MDTHGSPARKRVHRQPTAVRGRLSVRLLGVLLLALVVSSLIAQIPFALRYRQICLEQRFAAAQLIVSAQGRESARLLEQAGLLGVRGEDGVLLGRAPVAAIDYRLDEPQPSDLLTQLLSPLLHHQGQVIRLDGPGRDGQRLTVWLLKDPLDREVLDWTRDTLLFSLGVAVITALALYLVLQWLVVGSIRCITRNLIAFREDPLDQEKTLEPCGRRDELGFIERELYRLQWQLLSALDQQARLAALGTRVSRINHDLKSLLSTVSLAGGRLARIDDPTVQRIAPLLLNAVERAIHLCTESQDLARGERTVPECRIFPLDALVAEVGQGLETAAQTPFQWHDQVPPGCRVNADRDRLYRVLMNLGRNAMEAGAGQVWISARQAAQGTVLEVSDDGPGIPASLRRHLFRPFAGARAGGNGLGLATARDLVRAHGGELELLDSDARGTAFRITLPNAPG